VSVSAEQNRTRSLYDTLGGAVPLRVAVDRFYTAVLADPELAAYFDGVDVAHVKRHQILLLTQVLGGPQTYAGRDLGAAHRHLGVTSAHYDRVVDHLVATLQGLQAPRAVVAAVEGAVAGAKAEIVAPA
jgi:hemoglobin